MRYSESSRHELAQNFLIDRSIVDRVVELVAQRPGPIVEWGTGDGAITLGLHDLRRPLHGIEIDRSRALKLGRKVGPHACISEGDILRHAPPTGSVVVSNVPFHLTTPILRHYYLRARYYDPTTTQFLTTDPLIATTHTTYSYAINNPLNESDPSGQNGEYDEPGEEEGAEKAAADAINGFAANEAAAVRGADAVGEGDEDGECPTVAAPGRGTPGQSNIERGEDFNWANQSTLEDHFKDHGSDFDAASSSDYARKATEFYTKAGVMRYPTKATADGTIRIHDPATNTFGSYTSAGKTKTFFKPTSPTYWSRQPGRLVQ